MKPIKNVIHDLPLRLCPNVGETTGNITVDFDVGDQLLSDGFHSAHTGGKHVSAMRRDTSYS
jgi:hypothetical protein